MHDLAIETVGLCRDHGKQRVLDQVHLKVPRGSLYGFLGANGAGKTTTLRLLLDLLRATSGEVRLFDERFDAATRQSLLARIGVMAETPPGYPKLTGAQNLGVIARLLGVDRARIDDVLGRVGLHEAADKRFGAYSMGMRQRLSLAFALLARPPLLLLDEPTNGLDPAGVEQLRRLLRELNAEGVTVLMSSHQLVEVEQLVTHVGVLHQGRLLFQGGLAELHAAQPTVVEVVAEPMARASRCLQNGGWMVRVDGAGIEVRVDDVAAAAQINRLLHEAGCAVSRMAVRRPTLESLFLHLTDLRGSDPMPAHLAGAAA